MILTFIFIFQNLHLVCENLIVLHDLKKENSNILDQVSETKQNMIQFYEEIKIEIDTTVKKYPLNNTKHQKITLSLDYETESSAELSSVIVPRVFDHI